MNKSKYENRFYNFEIRGERMDNGISRLRGTAIVYSSPTDIGGMFREIIEPGALIGANLRDVPLLVNHNLQMIPVARSRNNNPKSTMRLTAADVGLEMEADIDTERNMTARELDSAVERGDLDGMSFWFSVSEERWDDLETEYPTRHILKFDTIREISAVTFPAYDATSISQARSKEVLESARSALENARQQTAESPDGDLELAKAKFNFVKSFGGN